MSTAPTCDWQKIKWGVDLAWKFYGCSDFAVDNFSKNIFCHVDFVF